MKKLLLPALILLSMTSANLAMANGEENKQKSVVGQIETIKVHELEMDFQARIDTGAATTSIHATDITVNGEEPDSEDMRDHLGEMVEFTSINENGDKATYKGKIIKVSKIRNAQGVERRYAVKMDLGWNGEHKTVAVNLRDRSKLDYKLLIGRNWLSGDYVVDVDKLDEDD
ncbi:RimK/LysX family protein [Photobacterium sp. SDRW27]|uniref:ATP-dependent zinc protease family protein n=1 Tax=Photobacterium obscurum TaxID=2829490 RepID=UPI002242F1AD|nr:RimK/LysX family protein [Photobacterium obscurum]MCW8329411.1 RimK/LysX family protein [Photobacterium obscurum]